MHRRNLVGDSRTEAFAGFGRRSGFGCGGGAALAQGLVHDDGTSDGDVEGGDGAGHGNTEEVVAGLLDEVVKAGAFAAEDEDAVGAEVEVGVVGRASFVEAEDPYVGLLHLFERADKVGDAGDADVLGGPGGGFGDDGGDGGRAAFGKEDAVYAGAVGGSEERAEVVGVFDAVEGEEETVLRGGIPGGEEVFDGEKGALADEGDGSLMGVGAADAGELVAGFEGYSHIGGAAHLGEALQAIVFALAGEHNAVQPTRA